jgi:hypothetical protein
MDAEHHVQGVKMKGKSRGIGDDISYRVDMNTACMRHGRIGGLLCNVEICVFVGDFCARW